jgi:hypothetical protein
MSCIPLASLLFTMAVWMKLAATMAKSEAAPLSSSCSGADNSVKRKTTLSVSVVFGAAGGAVNVADGELVGGREIVGVMVAVLGMGDIVGGLVGSDVGVIVGLFVGDSVVGNADGGSVEGARDGVLVGAFVGALVGIFVGILVGGFVATATGGAIGDATGCTVGAEKIGPLTGTAVVVAFAFAFALVDPVRTGAAVGVRGGVGRIMEAVVRGRMMNVAMR